MVTEGPAHEPLLVEADPWMSQGDIFEAITFPDSDAFDGGGDRAALLITHGCVLDKKSRNGDPTVQRLHFLPLQNVAAQIRDKQIALRNGVAKIDPSEVLYLGEVPVLEFEAFVVLSQPWTVAAAALSPRLVDVQGDDGVIMDRRLACADVHVRVARLSDSHLELLRDKMNAFWTRRVAN